MFHVKVCKGIFKFWFPTRVIKEDIINIPGVKQAVIVKLWIDMGFFKMSHVNCGIGLSYYNVHGTPFNL